MDKDTTITLLSNYITELKKEDLDRKGKKLLRTMQSILTHQLELEDTLSLLKGEKKIIESSNPMLFSYIRRHEHDRERAIEELSKDRNLNRILDLATNLVMRDKKR